MKKTMLFLSLVALSLWPWGTLEGQQKNQDLFKIYITTQQALAADDFQKAKNSTVELSGISEGKLKRLATIASEANNIKDLRSAFKPISGWIIKNGVPEEHMLVFCPMAENNTGGHWIQKKGEILNPYFGSSMLHCGTIKKPD